MFDPYRRYAAIDPGFGLSIQMKNSQLKLYSAGSLLAGANHNECWRNGQPGVIGDRRNRRLPNQIWHPSAPEYEAKEFSILAVFNYQITNLQNYQFPRRYNERST
jgi:hypothetical protein